LRTTLEPISPVPPMTTILMMCLSVGYIDTDRTVARSVTTTRLRRLLVARA
jgi:hypothetical protein